MHFALESGQLPAAELHRNLLLVVFDRLDGSDGAEIFADQQPGQPGEGVHILGFGGSDQSRDNPRRTVELASFHPECPAIADCDFHEVSLQTRELLALGLFERRPTAVDKLFPERFPILLWLGPEVDDLDAAEVTPDPGLQGRFQIFAQSFAHRGREGRMDRRLEHDAPNVGSLGFGIRRADGQRRNEQESECEAEPHGRPPGGDWQL